MEDSDIYKMNLSFHKPGITQDKVIDEYSEWAETYHRTMSLGVYNGPQIATNELASRIPEDRRYDVKVIDVAAGTGKIGLLLKDQGFKNIDALEPAKGMVEILEKTGVYSKTYIEFLGIGNNSVPNDAYDALVISGGMGEGHIPVNGIDDMIRITKPGGLVIIVMRKEYLDYVEEYKDKLVPYIDQLEKEGRWAKVEVKQVPRYSFDKDGLVFTYKVL